MISDIKAYKNPGVSLVWLVFLLSLKNRNSCSEVFYTEAWLKLIITKELL